VVAHVGVGVHGVLVRVIGGALGVALGLDGGGDDLVGVVGAVRWWWGVGVGSWRCVRLR